MTRRYSSSPRSSPIRRWLAAVTITAAVAVAWLLLGVNGSAHAQGFPDVSGDEYFAPALQQLSQEGIVQGREDGRFDPAGTVTRAHLAVFLARVLGLSDGDGVPFEDVAVDDWFYGQVCALYQAGLVSGTSATEFSPYKQVSRQQAATFVMRALAYVSQRDTGEDAYHLGPDQPIAPWLAGYRDRALLAQEHQVSVANAYRLGIMAGTAGGWLLPTLSLSRAQMVAILYRAFYQPIVISTDYPEQVEAVAFGDLSSGSRGPLVQMLESRLSELHYPCGPIDGVYDYRTRDAVLALEKVERLPRDGLVGPLVWQRLFSAGIPVPRYSGGGDRAEVDLTRQVLFMITDGEVAEVVHVSTGRLGTPTGHGQVYRKDPGWVTVPVGQMYSPSYIMPHIAIHGSKSVPNYPASHGCVRTPMWISDHLYAELPLGFPVDVYY